MRRRPRPSRSPRELLNRQDAATTAPARARRVTTRAAAQAVRASRAARRVAEGGDGRMRLGYRTASSGMTLASASTTCRHAQAPYQHGRAGRRRRGERRHHRRRRARRPDPRRQVRRLPVLATEVPPRELVRPLRAHAGRGPCATGFDALCWPPSERSLDQFWDRADVRVDSGRDPRGSQQAIRWNLFQLAQATWRAEGSGVPAKGLTRPGLRGPLLLGHPRSTCCRSSPTPSRGSRATCCASATACCRVRARARARARPARRDVPVAHDQRRGGVGRTTRPAPRSTTSTLTSPTRSGATSHARGDVDFLVEVGRRDPRRDGAAVGRPRLLRRRRRVPHPRRHRSRRVHDASSTTTRTRT